MSLRLLLLICALVVSAQYCAVVAAVECTSTQEGESEKLWKAAAATDACALYASTKDDSVSIVWPCSDSACTRVMRQLGTDLPQCLKRGTALSEKNSANSNVLKCDAAAGSQGGEEPSANYCLESQMVSMGDKFLQLVTSEACTLYKLISFTYVAVKAPCKSPCSTEIAQFSSQLYSCQAQAQWKKEIDGTLEYCELNPETDALVSYTFESYIQKSKYFPKDAPRDSAARSLSFAYGWIYVAAAAVFATELGKE